MSLPESNTDSDATEALAAALAATSLTSPLSKLVLPSSPSFPRASSPYNLLLSPQPLAIFYPPTPHGVASAVRAAARAGVPVVARSGGHSYAGYGLSDGALVISLERLDGIEVLEEGRAVVGTGNRLGAVVRRLWERGRRAVPTGTCPHVGIGGHASFGGYGPLSRMHGLILDRIVGAEVVLASGEIVHASKKEHSDLFWALRGAAPSFGIVTAWTFDTVPAPETMISFSIFFNSHPKETLVSAFDAFQRFMYTDPPGRLYAVVVLSPDGDGGVNLKIYGHHFDGDQEDLISVIRPLLDALPKGYDFHSEWHEGLAALEATLEPAVEHDRFYAKSLFIDAPLPLPTLESYFTYLFKEGTSTKLDWFAMSDPYNGAIHSVPSTSTAFPHRSVLFGFQLYANTSNSDPTIPEKEFFAFVDGMQRSITPHLQAAYANYCDPRLRPGEWPRVYFAGNLGRLREVKRVLDPGNVFRFPQSVEPAEE